MAGRNADLDHRDRLVLLVNMRVGSMRQTHPPHDEASKGVYHQNLLWVGGVPWNRGSHTARSGYEPHIPGRTKSLLWVCGEPRKPRVPHCQEHPSAAHCRRDQAGVLIDGEFHSRGCGWCSFTRMLHHWRGGRLPCLGRTCSCARRCVAWFWLTQQHCTGASYVTLALAEPALFMDFSTGTNARMHCACTCNARSACRSLLPSQSRALHLHPHWSVCV